MDRRSQAVWTFYGAMAEVRAAVDARRMTAREAVARLRVGLDRAAQTMRTRSAGRTWAEREEAGR